MDAQTIIYYLGFVLAIAVCWNLGKVFSIPMLLNLAFNLALNLKLLSGWDIRILIVSYCFAVFLWVIFLTGTFNRATFIALIVLDVGVAFNGIWPQIHSVGTGQSFWNATSTTIIDIWMVSIAGVVISMVIKSTIVAKAKGKFVDILTNPRKRFVHPIGAWAAIIVLGQYLAPIIPDLIVKNRFDIAAHVLVWGWVALETPFLFMYRRIRKQQA